MPASPVCEQLMDDLIRIDQVRAQGPEYAGNKAFSAGDSAGQSDNPHNFIPRNS